LINRELYWISRTTALQQILDGEKVYRYLPSKNNKGKILKRLIQELLDQIIFVIPWRLKWCWYYICMCNKCRQE
jgi:hypothetical protein